MAYEKLQDDCLACGACVCEMNLINDGLYADNVIAISSRLETTAEKVCVLAEELGHHKTTTGNILDLSKIENKKQELRARSWAYEKLVPLEKLINVRKQGIKNRYELAEYLDVTESFIEESIQYYKRKHGLYYQYNNFMICFEPFGIMEMFKF